MAKMLPLRDASSVCCSTTDRSLLRRGAFVARPSALLLALGAIPVLSVDAARNKSTFSTATPTAEAPVLVFERAGLLVLVREDALRIMLVVAGDWVESSAAALLSPSRARSSARVPPVSCTAQL